MTSPLAYVRVCLVIAMVLMCCTLLLCTFGYVSTPAQQMETRAELQQCQESGLPISNADIERHLSRLAISRQVYGSMVVPALLSELTMLIALILSWPKSKSSGGS